MRRTGIRWVVAAATVAAILGSSVLFTLREGQVAVVTRLGAPRRVVTDAGLHPKWPWPVERVHAFDARRRLFNARFAETLSRDKKNVVLRMFVVWSIGQPLTFLQAIGDPGVAEERLDGLVTNARNTMLGSYDLSALVSTDPGRLRIGELEDGILSEVAPTALERFGIRIHQVGFNRLGLPPENVPFVFDQMRAERAQYAARYRAEGDREAAAIRSQTDLEVATLRAEGRRKAAEIRGRAEAEAARIYAEAHRRDPEFYRFLRSLDSLKTVLGRRSTVILRTDAAPFQLLKDAGRGAAEPAAPAGEKPGQ
jgi:membrane protease subunit HflC